MEGDERNFSKDRYQWEATLLAGDNHTFASDVDAW